MIDVNCLSVILYDDTIINQNTVRRVFSFVLWLLAENCFERRVCSRVTIEIVALT